MVKSCACFGPRLSICFNYLCHAHDIEEVGTISKVFTYDALLSRDSNLSPQSGCATSWTTVVGCLIIWLKTGNKKRKKIIPKTAVGSIGIGFSGRKSRISSLEFSAAATVEPTASVATSVELLAATSVELLAATSVELLAATSVDMLAATGA